MNELSIIHKNGVDVIDSRSVAEPSAKTIGILSATSVTMRKSSKNLLSPTLG